MTKRKPAAKTEPKFPIYIHDTAHIAYLRDREVALRMLHDQVMQFLEPLQTEIAAKWRVWWDRFAEEHHIPSGTKMTLTGNRVDLAPLKEGEKP